VAEMGVGDTAAGSSSATALVWQHTNVWADGELIATYDGSAGSQSGTSTYGLHFYLNDPLGSRRAQTDYAGNVEQTCQSLPFGDGLSCSGSTVYPTEHHFTGKERDAESGNDYFGARYYASSMGRFMSPDWGGKSPVPYASFGDPQTLNLYSYMRNNPLGGTDPDGHCGLCWDLVQWAARSIARDGGVKPFANNVGTGIAKGAGRFGMTVGAGLAEKAVPGSIVGMSMNKTVQNAFQATSPSNQTQADVAPVGAALAGAALTAGVASGVGALDGALSGTAMTTVSHFTSDAGMAAISESGTLNAGTWVTLPSEIPAGASGADVESILEIGPGKGSNSITFDTPSSNLAVPDNGPETSGGAFQRQLINPQQIDPGTFKPTNPQ
jgi:RHS repeat-associated protein